MWSLHVFLVQSQPTCTVFPYPTLFRSEREQPAPLDRVGADRDQHRRQRLELQDARQKAQELGLAEHEEQAGAGGTRRNFLGDRKSTRLNSSHRTISYAVFCLKKKKNTV